MSTAELVQVSGSQDISYVPADYTDAVQRVVAQTKAIQQCMRAVMIKGVHYGVIPGTEKKDKDGRDITKPCLFQPGADVLCLLFRFRASYRHRIKERRNFIGIQVRCRLIHIPTGEVVAEAYGSANSREDRYLNQTTQRVCPACNQPTIFRSKARNGEDPATKGWFCWEKKGGCGSEFAKDDPQLSGQGGKVVGEKAWGLHNTILKMAIKRAKVAAVLAATGASDAFDQDLDDLMDADAGLREAAAGQHGEEPQPRRQAPPAAAAGNGNGNGGRATMIEIRDLNVALGEAEIPHDRRLEWVNGASGKTFGSLQELPKALCLEMTELARKAEAGTYPKPTPPPAKDNPVGTPPAQGSLPVGGKP